MSSDFDCSNEDHEYETVTFSGTKKEPDLIIDSEYAEIDELARSRPQEDSAPALPPARKQPAKRQASLGALTHPNKPFRPHIHKSPRPVSVDVSGLRSMQQLEEGVPMSLSDFVRAHSKNFPLRVSIEKGFCTSVEEAAISAGDTYNIHFMKYTKVVYVTRQDDGHEVYTIPMNSAVQVGLIYDPKGDIEQAIRGYQFETIAEIIAMVTLPKVVRATRAYKGTNASSSVDENEILVINKVSKAKFVGSTQLKVYSLTRRERKSLYLQCAGGFTTHPSSVCLYLPQLLLTVSDLFPSKAKLFFDTIAYEDLLEELPTGVVNLTHSSIETSLITTLYLEDSECSDDDDSKSMDECDMFDIPVSLDIDITVESLYENKKSELRKKTRTLFENFDPTLPKICRPANSSHAFATQALLFKAAREGHKKDGVQIEPPLSAFRSGTLLLSSSVLPTHYEELPLDKAGPPLPPKSFPHAPSKNDKQVSSSSSVSSTPVYYEDVRVGLSSHAVSENETGQSTSHLNSKDASSSNDNTLLLDTDENDSPSVSVKEEEEELPTSVVEPYMVPITRTNKLQVNKTSSLSRRPPLPIPPDLPALPPPHSSSQSPPPLSYPSSTPPLSAPPLSPSSLAAPPTPTTPAPTPSPSTAFPPPVFSQLPNDPLPSLQESVQTNQTLNEPDYVNMNQQKPPLAPKPKLSVPKASPPSVAAHDGVKLRRHQMDKINSPTRSPRPRSCPPRPHLHVLSNDDPLYDENGYIKTPHVQQGKPSTVGSGSIGDGTSDTATEESGERDHEMLQDQQPPLSSVVAVVQALDSRVAALEESTNTSAEEISSLVAEMAKFAPTIASLIQKQEEMEKELEHLRSLVAQSTAVNGTGSRAAEEKCAMLSIQEKQSNPDHVTTEENRQCLASLDVNQVIQLMKALELEEFLGSIIGDRISGAILLDYDENVLEGKLGLKERHHRDRLMQYISGRSSVKDILSI